MPDKDGQWTYIEAALFHEIQYQAMKIDWGDKRAVRKFLLTPPITEEQMKKTIEKRLRKRGFHFQMVH